MNHESGVLGGASPTGQSWDWPVLLLVLLLLTGCCKSEDRYSITTVRGVRVIKFDKATGAAWTLEDGTLTNGAEISYWETTMNEADFIARKQTARIDFIPEN